VSGLRGVVPIVIAAGVLDIIANVCYYVAVHQGPLSVVATLASLYPAATVLLAYALLREHLHVRQTIGLTAGLASVVLISIGR